jgi:hypothetical protein
MYHQSSFSSFCSEWDWPMPMMRTGCVALWRARSGVVTMMATAPSLMRQQSSRCSGSTIMREFWWSSIVNGSRMIAFGLRAACLRIVTPTQPSCSLVVP